MTLADLKTIRGYAPELMCQPIGSLDARQFQDAFHMAQVFAFLDSFA